MVAAVVAADAPAPPHAATAAAVTPHRHPLLCARAVPSFSPCSICHDELLRNPVRIECGHRFHDRCLCDWVSQPEGNALCPVCRARPTIGTLLSAMDVGWAESRLRERLRPLRRCAAPGCRRKEAPCNDGCCAEHADLARSVREGSLDARMWKAVLFMLAVVSSPAAEASRGDAVPGTLFRQVVSVVTHLARSLADVPAPRGSELLDERYRQVLMLWQRVGGYAETMRALGFAPLSDSLLVLHPPHATDDESGETTSS